MAAKIKRKICVQPVSDHPTAIWVRSLPENSKEGDQRRHLGDIATEYMLQYKCEHTQEKKVKPYKTNSKLKNCIIIAHF